MLSSLFFFRCYAACSSSGVRKLIKWVSRQHDHDLWLWVDTFVFVTVCYLFPKETFFLQQMQNSVMLFLNALQSPTIHEWCKWGRGEQLEHMTSRCWALRVMWEMWVVVVGTFRFPSVSLWFPVLSLLSLSQSGKKLKNNIFFKDS